MAYNDPMGEWIRPKPPDIFEHIPPPRPPGHLRRTQSCPPETFHECKLADLKGYLLWEDLFKMMNEKLGLPVSTQSADQTVAVALQKMATLGLQEKPVSAKFKSRSTTDLSMRRISEKNSVLVKKRKSSCFKIGPLTFCKNEENVNENSEDDTEVRKSGVSVMGWKCEIQKG